MHLFPDYSPDIFISYAHGDFDHTGQSPLKSWSVQFAEAFRSERRQQPQLKDVAVYRDESERPKEALDPTSALTAQLRKVAEGAAVLLILMSPQYLASSWCQDERAWWIGRHGTHGDGLNRIF